MERVCMYLRKSRADLEAEASGEGETLAKRPEMPLLFYLIVTKERKHETSRNLRPFFNR